MGNNNNEANRLEAVLERLERWAAAPDGQWLTDEELEGLRDLLTFREAIMAEQRRKAAARLIFQHYRAMVIALGAVVAGGMAAREYLGEILAWLKGP